MTKHVIVGAGPVGRAIAQELLERGDEVVLVTRSGTDLAGATSVRADAADADALTRAADGAATLFNAANPRDYHRWAEFWPPVTASLLSAAERSGAVLATVGNLYPYGPVDGPMHEDLPDAASYRNGRIRAEMSRAAFDAHRAGRLRAVEVRASDYIGAGAYSHVTVAARSLAKGRTAFVVGDPDQPHTWTSTRDTARTLVSAAARPDALGRTWIVPSNAPRTMHQVLDDIAAAGGRKTVRVRGTQRAVWRALGVVAPALAPMVDTYYQFDRPFVVDDTAAREQLGIEPTPWTQLVREVAGDILGNGPARRAADLPGSATVPAA